MSEYHVRVTLNMDAEDELDAVAKYRSLMSVDPKPEWLRSVDEVRVDRW